MSLEVKGGNTNSHAQSSASTDRGSRRDRTERGHGGTERKSNTEERKRQVDSSFQSITEMLRPRVGSKALGPRAELIHKWIKLSITESLDSLKDYNIRVGTISREQGYEVKYPGIIVAVNKKDSVRVAVHVLLVSDGVELEPRGKRRIYQGEDITPVPVPSMIWDEKYESQVKEETARMYSGDVTDQPAIVDIKFASMGCTVIPATMVISSYGDKPSNDDNPLDALFVNVVESLTSFERFLRRDNTLVKLGENFNGKTQMISANIDQVPAVEFDVVGQPRRSDFCISLSVKRRRSDRERDRDESDSYNQEDEADSGVILRVAGYVLPYYTEVDLDKRKPQNFGINIVLTDISGESTPSPELFIYGMAAASLLTSNDMWVDGFKPSVITATPNRNLGGLFLEIPDKNNESMERKTYPVSGVEDLLDDVDFLFSDRVKVSIDCCANGPLAWITDLFVFNEAQTLYDAADNLTAREFDDISHKDYPVIEKNATRRFYTGVGEGEHGQEDIRAVDYLQQINFADENTSLQAAKDFDLSIADDSEYGLFARKQAIEDTYGHGSYKITGTVDRVVVNHEFFQDVVDSLSLLDMLPSFDSFSKNYRPKSRLEAADVQGAMSSRDVGSAYRGRGNRGMSRDRSGYRSRD